MVILKLIQVIMSYAVVWNPKKEWYDIVTEVPTTPVWTSDNEQWRLSDTAPDSLFVLASLSGLSSTSSLSSLSSLPSLPNPNEERGCPGDRVGTRLTSPISGIH